MSGSYKLRNDEIREQKMTVNTLDGTVLPGVKASACGLIAVVQVAICLKIILHAIFSMKALRKKETPFVCGSSQEADKPSP